jgi:hypothetical protein
MWGLIGALLLALILGGVLLIVLLQPRTNSTTTTINPTPGSTNPTAISQPTQATSPSGNASDTARTFYNHLGAGNYDAAFNLMSSDAQARFNDANGLREIWDLESRARGGNLQSVSIDNVSEQGDTATVTVTLTFGSGETMQVENALVRSGNRWLMSEF